MISPKESRTVMFEVEPRGPFDLASQNRHFGGWPAHPDDPDAVVMAFPLEEPGAEGHSAAVVVRQSRAGTVTADVHGCPPDLAPRAHDQALAALSLDVDGTGWPEVGRRDPVIGNLQERYGYLRPTLFHSPYEAAVGFVIGHRISIRQARAIRARIASGYGAEITIAGSHFHAFPTPERLLGLTELPGVSATKLERLHAIARAAADGWLTRAELRGSPHDEALARLESLPGIGRFFAQGILYRGAGTVDTLTDEAIFQHAVAHSHGAADPEAVAEVARAWRPYRMWAVVLLHVWARNELELPSRERRRARSIR